MNRILLQRLRLLASALSVLALVAVLAGVWFYFQLRASLPQLDGTRTLAGLAAPVTIERDDHGAPTLRGANREDVARALGFLHAQDRYFQMDLLRRRAAGELAELFGATALPLDRENRPHRFRALAGRVFNELPVAHRALLESYAAGVNAGLASLRQRPFEYLFLRTDPRPWTAVDSVLVIYAMTLDLQDPTNAYERSLLTLRDELGPAALAFFAPLLTPDDAALDGSKGELAPVPGPQAIDLRVDRPDTASSPGASRRDFAVDFASDDLRPGSNSFAVSGAHTASGAALLANDPHLTLAVPNIWYRAVLEWPAAGGGPAGTQRVVGVTLPGLPLVVLGSNGHIAWGLTVAYADTNDLVAIDVNPVSPRLYRIPGQAELQEIETRRDTIAVKGAAAETVEMQWTHWGPIIGFDDRERPLAHRWMAYDVTATNLEFLRLETARNVTVAVAIAQDAGIPPHNFLVADRAGAIAWTIAGKLPRRVGFDGRLPVSWTFGDRRWDGHVAPVEVPSVFTPPGGRLWTANHRMLGGDALARMGDGGYAMPARAAQVRDGLEKIVRPTPRSFAALQMDDRALFLERWQKLLLATLTAEAVAGKASRAEFRRLAENWTARASVDAVGYRLVRAFRAATAELALAPIFAGCVARMPDFDWHHFNYEPALWTLLHEQPPHLLARGFDSWDELLMAAVDTVIEDLERQRLPLDRATWGERNRARIRHPFSHVLPGWLAHRLNFPSDPLPGDEHMPLIQARSYGASTRLVVSPGHEEEALFQMPGGQSGHPLSPFYRADHDAWVKGDPAHLMPDETIHTLTLVP